MQDVQWSLPHRTIQRDKYVSRKLMNYVVRVMSLLGNGLRCDGPLIEHDHSG